MESIISHHCNCLILRVQTQRFEFLALESVFFPTGKAGNVFRGALGLVMPEMAVPGRLPGGFADPPRPFVLRAAHLDGRVIEPGRTFGVDVNVFDLKNGFPQKLGKAFEELSRTGLGPRRGRVELMPVAPAEDVVVELAPQTPVARTTVRFVTPTDLKGLAAHTAEVPFEVLFMRARDRVSALVSLYDEGPLDADFDGLAQRAALVGTVNCELLYRNVVRKSSRTGRTHGIGGFTGTAVYEGDLTEFMPWLGAAWWTGVGRHTVWGNGVIACE
jgi:hypothetical protein